MMKNMSKLNKLFCIIVPTCGVVISPYSPQYNVHNHLYFYHSFYDISHHIRIRLDKTDKLVFDDVRGTTIM